MTAETPIAAIALVRDDGSVLLQLRDDRPTITHAGKWVFPGGHSAAGETALSCARRELAEEAAYEAAELVHLGPLHDPRNGAPQIDLFCVRYDGRQQIECREGADMRWVTRAEAALLPTPRFILDAWDALVVPHVSATHDPLEAST